MPLSDSVVLKKPMVVRLLAEAKERRKIVGSDLPRFELKIFDVSEFVVARQGSDVQSLLKPITFFWRRVGQFHARLIAYGNGVNPLDGSSIVELGFKRSVERVSKAFRITLNFHTNSKISTGPPKIPKRVQAWLDDLNTSQKPGSKNYSRPRLPSGSFSQSLQKRKNPEIRATTYVSRVETQSNPGVDSTNSYEGYKRSWSGTTTPNFRNLKGSKLPQNAHSCEIKTVRDGQAIYADYWTNSNFWTVQLGSTSQLYGSQGQVAAPAFSHLASASNKALGKVVARVGSDINNVAQDFTQYRQTVGLIANNAARLTGAIKDLQRGNIAGVIESLFHGKARFRAGGGPSVTKSLANNWLEFQYGWKPLMHDIRASMEATAQLVNKSPPFRRVSARASTIEKSRNDITSVQPFAIGKREVTLRSTCRVGFRFVVEDDFKAYLQKLGFTNPINLLWEVIPYSFVVDWFLPIGPYLETLTAWQGLKFLDGYQTQFSKQSTISTVNLMHKQWNLSIPEFGDFAGAYDCEWIKLNRGKLTSFPQSRFPQLKNPISVTHAVNALALLRVAFGSGQKWSR
jgi:hypothetical protein